MTTDPPRLSDKDLDVIQEQVQQVYVAAERDPCLRHIGEHKKIADVANAIAQLRTSLAAANKRAEEWQRLAELGGTACDQLRTQLAEARDLLERAIPFIGWASKPDGLVEKCDDFVARLTQDNNKENADE